MTQKNVNISNEQHEGQKCQQLFCTIIASIGALIVGSVLAWTSPSLRFLSSDNYSAPFILGSRQEGDMIAAFTPLGALVGALPAGLLADLLGRKLIMVIFAVPWIVSWTLTTFAANVIILYVARFISGLVLGLFCGVLPLYINEIAEDSIRGCLGTIFQVSLTLGELLVYILGLFDSYSILCRVMTAVCVAFFCALFLITESPTYLMKKNRETQAEKSLRRLRGTRFDVNFELNSIRERLSTAAVRGSTGTFFTKAKIKALIICIGLMFIQQFCGVNSVIFFSDTIFQNAGTSSPAICTVVVGITQTFATIISGLLVDRAGRKILLLISCASTGISQLALGYYFWMLDTNKDTSQINWLPLCSLVCFIVGFSLGLGPIPWTISVELLDPGIKSIGATLTAATNLSCVALVTFTFQPLMNAITRAYTFWLYAVICALGTIFVLTLIPETRGKSIQEMQNILAGKRSA